ncbi:hypothetical protein DEA06_09525 [Microbacterium sp. Gd 4-13]|nr:hypothetical protein DEA06_09525 [Microbacterium sp. Gd 4-13]
MRGGAHPGRMKRAELPPSLQGASFRTNAARAAGVARDRLDAADLFAPFHGVRAPADALRDSVLDRCRLFLPRLDGLQFFSHSTAAALWQMLLPRSAEMGPLHVAACPPARAPRTTGVIGHRTDLTAEMLTLAQGLPVPSVAETWAQLGSILTLDDLVAAADGILTAGSASAEDLAAAVVRLRRRGARDLARALSEMRTGSESRPETRTRLVLSRAGLPEPELNQDLRSADGRFIARLDIAYRRYRVCVEYDGRQHAEHAQFARDADRWADIEAEGWIIVRVLAHHLADPPSFVARVERALRSRGWSRAN